MDGDKQNNLYLCCFCGNLIISSNGNPTEIDMLMNFDKPKNEQKNQSLYCHMECFKKELDPKLKIHFHLDTFVSEE